MTPEEQAHYEGLIKEEIAKRFEAPNESHPLQNELYSAGGGLAGAVAGIGSINAIDTVLEQRALRHADKMNLNRDAFRMLKNIHDGKASWNDVAPEARAGLREMYKQYGNLWDDNAEFKRVMDSFGPEKVVRLFPDAVESKGAVLKRALPNGKLFNDFGATLRHPAVSVGSLAGMAGGYYLSRQKDKERQQGLFT